MKDQSCNLNTCFLCNHCIPEWKEVIALNKKIIFFKKGATIFKEGEKVAGIYFVYIGAVKVHKRWIAEKELIIRFAVAGDILGHRGLGGADIYPVSATALVDSEACFVSAQFLETTLKTNHSLTYKLMQFYVTELQKAEMRMRNLAHMEVNSRIAETLMEIHTLFGIDQNKYIKVAVTRQDIAAYSGTTYETVFKFLRDLINKKIISVSGKSIGINDINKLNGFITEIK